MQYDFQSHQQDRLPRILLCLHGFRYSERLAVQNLQFLDTAETSRIIPKWLFPPCFSDEIGLPPAVRMLYWLLPSPRKLKSNRLAMKEDGFLEVAGGN